MRYFKRVLAGIGLLIAAAIIGTAFAAPSGTTVGVGSSSLGRILVDAHGKTLYMWAHDKGSKSTCTGDCVEYWPPFIAHGTPTAVRGTNSRLLGTSRRADGRRQVTYAGHPLYYFVQDTKPGQTKGEGLTGFGGRWDPVSSTGVAVRKPMTSYPAKSPTTSYPATSPATSYPADSGEPLQATVFSPGPDDSAGVGGLFSVEVGLQARAPGANGLLSAYTTAFNDPNASTFHPGPNAAAPGLVVLLSTTPTIDGTPLHGPNTNLAGVFEINDVSRVKGLAHTFHSWIVTKAGFFGQGTRATLTAYAVDGTAPAVVTGSEQPISNVVRETFTIAG